MEPFPLNNMEPFPLNNMESLKKMPQRHVFTEAEKQCLQKLMMKYKINKTDRSRQSLRKELWIRLANEFNSRKLNTHRTVAQLKKCLDNIRTRRRLALAVDLELAHDSGQPKLPTQPNITPNTLPTIKQENVGGGQSICEVYIESPQVTVIKQESVAEIDDTSVEPQMRDDDTPQESNSHFSECSQPNSTKAFDNSGGVSNEEFGTLKDHYSWTQMQDELYRLKVAEQQWLTKAAKKKHDEQECLFKAAQLKFEEQQWHAKVAEQKFILAQMERQTAEIHFKKIKNEQGADIIR